MALYRPIQCVAPCDDDRGVLGDGLARQPPDHHHDLLGHDKRRLVLLVQGGGDGAYIRWTLGRYLDTIARITAQRSCWAEGGHLRSWTLALQPPLTMLTARWTRLALSRCAGSWSTIRRTCWEILSCSLLRLIEDDTILHEFRVVHSDIVEHLENDMRLFRRCLSR